MALVEDFAELAFPPDGWRACLGGGDGPHGGIGEQQRQHGFAVREQARHVAAEGEAVADGVVGDAAQDGVQQGEGVAGGHVGQRQSGAEAEVVTAHFVDVGFRDALDVDAGAQVEGGGAAGGGGDLGAAREVARAFVAAPGIDGLLGGVGAQIGDVGGDHRGTSCDFFQMVSGVMGSSVSCAPMARETAWERQPGMPTMPCSPRPRRP